MVITLSGDCIYLLAMLKATLLVGTVGLALTIPLAIVGDPVFLRIGAVPVVLSFTALGFEGRQEAEEEFGGEDDLFEDDDAVADAEEGGSNSGDDVERGRSDGQRGPVQPSEHFLRPQTWLETTETRYAWNQTSRTNLGQRLHPR